MAGAPLVAAPANDWRLFEVGFGAADAFERGHIPGAGYIDTSELESGPLWNKVPDGALEQVLLGHGIRHGVTVALYRRLLDSGVAAWNRVGLALAQGRARGHPQALDFGVAFPARPDYLVDMPLARRLLSGADGALVSIRTWNETIGKTSGYSYIDARGDSVPAFHRGDGCTKPCAEIEHMWRAGGAGAYTVFYCGTGWRASLAFFYAWLMHWERIGVYDGS